MNFFSLKGREETCACLR